MILTVSARRRVVGEVRVPSDKSLTHRAYLLGSIAASPSVIRLPLRGEDCEATRRAVETLGWATIEESAGETRVYPRTGGVAQAEIDCGNSGTTMRLLCGLLASRPVTAVLRGDASLSRRPMGRIAEPLRRMGARVEGERPPLSVQGGSLIGIDYSSSVASAQVKSCVLLAGLRADGRTTVREPSLSRNHTERMLSATGVALESGEGWASVEGGQQPTGFEFTVPGDISSAAFWMVATAILPDSFLTFREQSVNPTRTGILDVLAEIGVPFEVENLRDSLGEPVADVSVRCPATRRAFTVAGGLVPRLIDEIPVLAVLATQCDGETFIRDARELRVKESDRIARVAEGLRAMGANVTATDDGFVILGPTPLTGTEIDAEGDHRIAMAFAIAGLVASGETVIRNADSIRTSYPDFEQHLHDLTE